MSSATLLASAALALATGLGFGLAGRLMLQRAGASPASAARVMFALFWASAAIIWWTQGLQSLAGALDRATFAWVSALDQVSSAFYCLAAAGLLYYVLYLITGRERLLAPILAFYLVVFVLLRLVVESAGREGVAVGDFVVGFQYRTPLQGPAYTAVVALLAGPLLLAVLAYGALAFRVDDPERKHRIALTAAGLLAWIATEAFSYTSGLANTTTGEFLRRGVALASTLVVLAAYRPPRWVRARWAPLQ